MKRIIIAILIIIGIVFLYLTLALNNKRKEFQDFKKKIELDSASYHSTHKLDTEEKGKFYGDKGGLGLKRIPLIKPYELIKVSSEEWRMNLQTSELLALSIHNIKSVNVTKEKILLFSDGTEVRNIQYGKGWFIIDPIAQKEIFFKEYKEYSTNISRIGLTDTTLVFPDLIYDNFYNGRLKWAQ